jgi:ceramide glucosyltransferase
MVTTLLASLVLAADLALLLGSAALALAAPRLARRCAVPGELPPVTIVVPLGGSGEGGAAAAAASLARLDPPAAAVVLASADPAAPAGRGRGWLNPKVATLAPAIAAATTPLVLIKDQRTILAPGALAAMAARLTPETGLVCALPIAAPDGSLARALDAAFVTLYGGRLVLAAAALGGPVGLGAAMLVRRADLERTGALDAMGGSVADDQALAKAMRRAGLGTAIAEGVALQDGGPRTLSEVFARHLRWAVCRRIEAPLAFAAEPACGLAAAAIAAALAAPGLGLPAAAAALAVAFLWILVETGLAALKGWPLSPGMAAAILLREAMLPAVWGAALATRRIVWGGRAIALSGPAGTRPA